MTDARTPPVELEHAFAQAKVHAQDIGEHLDLLRGLAAQVDHVTEMGTRWANGSTIALLAAQPASFVAWDLDPKAIVSPQVQALLSVAGRTRFQPRVGSTLEITIEETDFLFIDTLHTYPQLRRELALHAPRVRRFIALHDTATFGERGEDGSTPGLRRAVHEFQMGQVLRAGTSSWMPLWNATIDRKNCNGLIVLERVSGGKASACAS